MDNPYSPPRAEQEHAPQPPAAPSPTRQSPPPSPHHDRPSSPVGGPASPQQPDPVKAKAAAKQVLLFGVFVLLTLLSTALPLPYQVIGLATVTVSIVVGTRAMIGLWRAGVRGPSVPVLAVGLFFSVLMAGSMTMLLMVWPEQMARQDCLRRALTISAQEQCETDFTDAVSQRLATRGQGAGSLWNWGQLGSASPGG